MKTVAAYRFHPSSIGALMSTPTSMDLSLLSLDERSIWQRKSRTDEEQLLMDECRERALSVGAKTYVANIAKEFLFDYKRDFDSKELRKGRMLEPDAINLVNQVRFTRFKKHVGRVEDDLLSGECDILVPDVETHDTKVSWSADTFPILAEDAHDPMYEWQGRGYMRLYKTKRHLVHYCLLDTPAELLRGEPNDAHLVEHFDPKLRVTTITYEYCPIKERKMVIKLKAAHKYLAQLVARINAEHGVVPDWKKQFLTT